MRSRKRRTGFTLVELMAVVIIIGILAAIVTPVIANRIDKARINATHAQIKAIEGALAQYKFDTGNFPLTAEGIQALVSKPGSYKGVWPKGGYLPKMPRDAWDNNFVYMCPGTGDQPYTIISYGADRAEGGQDENADITN